MKQIYDENGSVRGDARFYSRYPHYGLVQDIPTHVNPFERVVNRLLDIEVDRDNNPENPLYKISRHAGCESLKKLLV